MAASNDTPARWLSIVGLGESGRDGLSPAANQLIDGAVLVGGRRAAPCPGWRGPGRKRSNGGSPSATRSRAFWSGAAQPVCVLASGDPFWFGAGAVLARICGPGRDAGAARAPVLLARRCAARLADAGRGDARPAHQARGDFAAPPARRPAHPGAIARRLDAGASGGAARALRLRRLGAACDGGAGGPARARAPAAGEGRDWRALRRAESHRHRGQGRARRKTDPVRARPARQLFRA